MGYAKAYDRDERDSTASRLLATILLSLAALLVAVGMALVFLFLIVDRVLAGILAPIFTGLIEAGALIAWAGTAFEIVFLLATNWTELAWTLVRWLASGFGS